MSSIDPQYRRHGLLHLRHGFSIDTPVSQVRQITAQPTKSVRRDALCLCQHQRLRRTPGSLFAGSCRAQGASHRIGDGMQRKQGHAGPSLQADSNRRVSTNSRWPSASAAVKRPLTVRIIISSN